MTTNISIKKNKKFLKKLQFKNRDRQIKSTQTHAYGIIVTKTILKIKISEWDISKIPNEKK